MEKTIAIAICQRIDRCRNEMKKENLKRKKIIIIVVIVIIVIIKKEREA